LNQAIAARSSAWRDIAALLEPLARESQSRVEPRSHVFERDYRGELDELGFVQVRKKPDDESVVDGRWGVRHRFGVFHDQSLNLVTLILTEHVHHIDEIGVLRDLHRGQARTRPRFADAWLPLGAPNVQAR
jgi:hypothetical protein